MTQNGNRAQGVGPWDAADCKAQLGNPFKPVGAKNKAPTAGNPRRLTPAARRQIEIVHRYRGIGAQNWTIVLNDGASRKIVSTFTSKGEAIEQLGFFSKELRAKIVGRGSAVLR
jgi:hypothetical protein